MNRNKHHTSGAIQWGIIGFGNMTEALIKGALNAKKISPQQMVSLKHRDRRDQEIKRRYKIALAEHIQDLSLASDVILLGVKPQQMREVLILLKPYFRNQLVITVAAGLPIKYYQHFLGKNLRIIRVMPNMPSAIGLGAAGFFANKKCSSVDKNICTNFFSASGLIEEVKSEKLIDAVISVSGSGPAFLFRYVQGVMAGGKNLGLKPDITRRLTLQTLLGAVQLLMQTGEDPETLINRVASKKGTTLAGLAVLKKKKFTRIIEGAMTQACKRSAQIAKEMGKIT